MHAIVNSAAQNYKYTGTGTQFACTLQTYFLSPNHPFAMQQTPAPENGGTQKEEQTGSTLPPDLHAEEDGRNKEWEDRARVNLETVPPGVQTNLERDFEPEQQGPTAHDEPAY